MSCRSQPVAVQYGFARALRDVSVDSATNKPSFLQLYAGLSTAGLVILLIACIWLGMSVRNLESQLAEKGSGGPAAGEQPKGPPSPVIVDTVNQEQVQRRRLVTGQIEAIRHTTVAAEESGLVIQAPPEQGTAVKQGDVLARFDTKLMQTNKRVAEAGLAEAQAKVNEAQATLTEADALVDRFDALIKEGAVTQVEYDRAVRDANVARAQLATAEAAVASREAEIESIDIQLGKMVVRAPFDGYIVAKQAELGQWLAPGGPVAEMVATDKVDAVLQVPESMVDAIEADEPIVVRLPALDTEFTGKLFRIVPNADREARTLDVLIRLDNADGLIKPGMSAESEMPVGQMMQALTVPRSAVKTTPMGLQVWTNRGGMAIPVSVVGKFMVGDRMVVEGQLSPGEQVVVEGNERLHPTAPLTVQNGEELAAKPQAESVKPEPAAQ